MYRNFVIVFPSLAKYSLTSLGVAIDRHNCIGEGQEKHDHQSVSTSEGKRQNTTRGVWEVCGSRQSERRGQTYFFWRGKASAAAGRWGGELEWGGGWQS